MIPILMAASTAVTAVGQLQSGLYASQVARNQAAVAAQNKQLTRENAFDAIDRGQDEQRRLGREVARMVGMQEARIGANNVDVSYGSAARTIDDTRMIGREDATAINENTGRQVRGLQIEAWGHEAEARAQLAESRQAKVGAAFGVASTILGGASQYETFKNRFPK